MRVLQIINSLATGGAENLLLETIPVYRRRGIKMDILLLWDNDHRFTQKLMKLNCCRIFILNKSNRKKSIYDPRNIFKIMRYLKDYDIAHVHLFPAQYYVVFASILSNSKCKLVFTEHNTTNKRIKSTFFFPIERVIYGHYSKIICITKEIQDIYKRYLRGLANRFVVIKNGVNLSDIQNASQLTEGEIHPLLKKEDELIVQVSAFRRQKDQKTAIRAISKIKNPFVKLLLVGEGPYREECENLARVLGLEGRVMFLGQRMDVYRILKSASIVLLSSYYEGLSLSSIEGMASGKPFVASDVPGLTDVVSGAGILFKRGDEIELASIIERLLFDKIYYNKIAKSCRERASYFDISKMIDNHIVLYHSINKCNA